MGGGGGVATRNTGPYIHIYIYMCVHTHTPCEVVPLRVKIAERHAQGTCLLSLPVPNSWLLVWGGNGGS